MSTKRWLFLILGTAVILRLLGLGTGDPMGDEVLYGFRAIEMLDYDNAEFQTTPLEWQDPQQQWWTKLSFHDHPPLVFLIQNFFIKIFGASPFAFRFPSAILGVLSVFLVYLIGRRLLSENAGLFATAAMTITANAVFISRVGLQESYVIFFMLLAFHWFLLALEKEKYFLWVGTAIGLGLLAKYTSFVIVPAFLIYLVLYKRNVFKNKYFWMGIALAFAVFSPVIVYNVMLYKTTGHFDFQLSYIFNQDPAVWQSAPGKEEIGAFGDRLKNFIPNLVNTNSWLFLALFAAGAIPAIRKSKLLLLSLVSCFLSLLLVGPTLR
ncbi:MAG: glycosyltransferase family 39 protein, partial [Patescibacteria group bacterium]